MLVRTAAVRFLKDKDIAEILRVHVHVRVHALPKLTLISWGC